MPIYIPLSLLFPALTGVVNILDKLIVDRYSPTTYVYVFWIGVWELAAGSIISGILSSQGLESRTLVGGMLTGAVSAGALILYLSALRFGQVARVVPIWFLYPLMVAPMAAGFLGERISPLVAGAILLAVAGGVLVSWQGSTASRTFGNPAMPLLALAAGGFLAVSFILNKHFVEGADFWQFFGFYRLGFAVPMLGIALVPEVRRVAPGMAGNRGFMGLVMLTEGIVSIVLIVRFAAVSLGPVSLVAAISAVQPSLVFLYSLALANLSPTNFGGWITRRTLRPQAAGIAAITASVIIISLQ